MGSLKYNAPRQLNNWHLSLVGATGLPISLLSRLVIS